MILDLEQFIAQGQPTWQAFERQLDRLDKTPHNGMSVEDLKHMYELYERTSADLVKIGTFSAEPATRAYLETLIARAYSRIHVTQPRKRTPWSVNRSLNEFAVTVKSHHRALIVVVSVGVCSFTVNGSHALVAPT